MKGYSNSNINHVNLNSLLSSNSSQDILKIFSQQFMPLEKSHSENIMKEEMDDDNMTPSEIALTKSMSAKHSSK